VKLVLLHGAGVRLVLDDLIARAGTDLASLLVSETGARVVVSVPRNFEDRFVNLCQVRGQTAAKIGTTQGTGQEARLEIQGVFDASAQELRELSAGVLPGLFG